MKNRIKEIVQASIKTAYPKTGDFNFSVEGTNPKFGDYATNVAMVLRKRVGKSPEEIAQKIVDSIVSDETFEKVEVVKPGFISGACKASLQRRGEATCFINFKIAIPYLQNKISEIIVAGEKYGDSDLGTDLKVNVEFISANPTGPLTLGNGRGGYTGDCLANVLESFGAKVEREYYINDQGAQILKLGHSVLKDTQAVYKGAYIDEVASKIKSEDPMEAGQQAAAIFMEKSIKKTILKMGIKFDHWFSQNALYKGAIEDAIGMLESNKMTYKKEGALWLKTTENGDDKDRVLITKEGEYTYFASDIAYHWDKIRRGYNLLIDFWGADHHGYVGRMMAAIEILRKEADWSGELKIMIAQLVRLISKGQEVKMSKRAGTFVTLDELIDEVGPDVTRFFFLERALNTHMDFDLDLAKEKSEKNPVYYVQYAYARIHSILAKSKIKKQISKSDLDLIKKPAEISLIKELIKLPDIIIETAEDYQVQRLPYYAIELATKFHNFYEQCRVISEDENLTMARIALIKATQTVLKKTLDLMGISAPEKM